MQIRLAIAALMVAVATGLGLWAVFRGDGGSPAPNPAVGRIESETDCATLQGEFDRAEGNGHTDYMQAADRRMRAIGCYGR